MSKRDKGQAASSYSLKVYCGYLPAHLRPEPRGEFWGFEACYSFVWFTKVYRPGKIWGRGHLLRKNFSLSLQARCIIVVWKKRWWVVWGGRLHPGLPKNLKKIFTWNLTCDISLNCLFLSIGTRYCLETLFICRADVAEEFTSVFKKLQKC